MLRRPGICLALHPEEGCSSNAFDRSLTTLVAVWNNPEERGFATNVVNDRSELP
jgi:hypothetical protein